MLVSLDIETERASSVTNKKNYDALIPHKANITCVGVWLEDGFNKVFRGPDLISKLHTFLKTVDAEAKGGLELVGQNFKFDIKHLHFAGIDGNWLIDKWSHDTQLMAYVHPEKIPEGWLEEYEAKRVEENKKLPHGYSHRAASKHSLKTLAPYHLGIEPFWEDPTNHDNDEYVLKDVKYTYELFLCLKKIMHESDFEFYINKQLPWSKELLRAELRGINVDNDELIRLKGEVESDLERVDSEIKEQWKPYFEEWAALKEQEELERINEMEGRAIARLKDHSKIPDVIRRHDEKREVNLKKLDTSFNLNSPAQLKWLLQDKLNLDITKIDGSESTDKEVLEALSVNNKEVALLLEHRALNKLASAYFPSYEDFTNNGRIHASFNPTGTKTGRLSSNSPNLQQVPKYVRPLFKVDPGYKYISFDFSAIEPRLLAYYSEDETLVNVFLKGLDFHGVTAAAMFEYVDCQNKEIKEKFPKERGAAKTLGLAILYGSGVSMVKEILFKAGFTGYSESDCRRIVKNIRNTYKGVWKFKTGLDKKFEGGRTISNILGRPIKFDDRSEVYMKGLNRLIQGSASDIGLESAKRYNELMRAEGIDSQFVALVHDEILVTAPEEAVEFCESSLIKIMTGWDLNTDLGKIELKVEGGVSDIWTK